MERVNVLMLARNNRALTEQAVRSVFAQDVPVFLRLISNGSTDGVNEWARREQARGKPIALVAFPHNTGVSAAWNHGLRYLFDRCHVPLVIVSNNDVLWRPDTARTLVDDGGMFVTGVGVDSLAASQEPLELSRRPHPDFSLFLLRREVWRTVGEFDATMFGWASDGDYHARMQQAGIQAYACGLPFYHVASGTLKHVSLDERRELEKMADRDRDRFATKWGVQMGSPEYGKLFTAVEPEAQKSPDSL